MSVRIVCPKCLAKLALPEATIGKKGQCGSCKHIFVVERPPEEAVMVAEVVAEPEPPLVAEIVDEPAKPDPAWEKKKKKKPRRSQEDREADEDERDRGPLIKTPGQRPQRRMSRLVLYLLTLAFTTSMAAVIIVGLLVYSMYRVREQGRAQQAQENAEREAEERPIRANRAKVIKDTELEPKKLGFSATPIFSKSERLEDSDPIDPHTNSMSKSYPVHFKANKQYAIYLIGTDPNELGFNPTVSLRNLDNTVRWNEDHEVVSNVYSRILFFSEREEDLRIVVSSKGHPRGLPGKFRLAVHVKD